MPRFHVDIVQLVDAAQPGWVECGMVDGHGVRHSFVEKIPIVTTEHLSENSVFPRDGHIRCTFVSRRELSDGRNLVCVDTTSPDGVESTAGETRFELTSSRLLPDEVVRTLVGTGTWLYSGSVQCVVRVIESNVAFGTGAYEDEAELAEDRLERCFYVEWAPHDDPTGVSSTTGPFSTLDDAQAHVQLASNATVSWDPALVRGRPTTV